MNVFLPFYILMNLWYPLNRRMWISHNTEELWAPTLQMGNLEWVLPFFLSSSPLPYTLPLPPLSSYFSLCPLLLSDKKIQNLGSRTMSLPNGVQWLPGRDMKAHVGSLEAGDGKRAHSEFCPQAWCCQRSLVSVHQINGTICLSWFKWASVTWKQRGLSKVLELMLLWKTTFLWVGATALMPPFHVSRARLLAPWARVEEKVGWRWLSRWNSLYIPH